MKEKRKIVYHGFGFPITIPDAHIKIIAGEEVLDIDMHKLQIAVLKLLIFKTTPLIGEQLRFIRKYLGMSTTEFAKKFGVTHPTIIKWEKNQNSINPATDFYIRLYVLQKIQEEDLRRLCTEITAERLAAHKYEKESILVVDQNLLIAC
jgi:transcriptional regulator with XRE-family HTH domain